MDNLLIEETRYTPYINFDNKKHLLEIKGKSYPENTSLFYTPVFSWLEEYLASVSDEQITVNIELVYFNSSSSKVLLDYFDILEEASEQGKQIRVNWIYDAEDEDALEFGEEFQEDYESLIFHMTEKEK